MTMNWIEYTEKDKYQRIVCTDVGKLEKVHCIQYDGEVRVINKITADGEDFYINFEQKLSILIGGCFVYMSPKNPEFKCKIYPDKNNESLSVEVSTNNKESACTDPRIVLLVYLIQLGTYRIRTNPNYTWLESLAKQIEKMSREKAFATLSNEPWYIFTPRKRVDGDFALDRFYTMYPKGDIFR